MAEDFSGVSSRKLGTAEQALKWRKRRNSGFLSISFILAFFTIILLTLTLFIMLYFGLPLFSHPLTVWQLFTENNWKPSNDQFGALAIIVGTFIIGVPSLILGIFWGFSSAIFLSEYLPTRLSRFLQPIIEFIAAIPSVIFGLLAFTVLSHVIRFIFGSDISRFFFSIFGVGVGIIPTETILAAALTLSFMAMPVITSISLDAMKTTPQFQRYSVLAFGGTKWEIFATVVYPHAKKSMLASVLLAFGRVIGETIVVLIIIGNSPLISLFLLDPAITITSAIALYFGEAEQGSTLRHSLFILGFTLLLFTMVLIWVSSLITNQNKRFFKIIDFFWKPVGYLERKIGNLRQKLVKENQLSLELIAQRFQTRKRINLTMKVALGLILFVFFVFVFGLLSVLVINGLNYYFKDGTIFGFFNRVAIMLFQNPSLKLARQGLYGAFSAITGSILLVSLGAIFAFPIATITGVYLSEFANQNRVAEIIKQSVINISAIPSIVIGLFVYATFVLGLGFGTSLLSGSIALGVMMIPIITTNTIEALRNTEQQHTISALALGATKWEAFKQHKLPYSSSSILTGYVLGIARVIGETAPILFTAVTISTTRLIPSSLTNEAVRALPYDIFYNLLFATRRYEGDLIGPEWGAALSLVLLFVILIINFIGYGLRGVLRKRYEYNGSI